MGTWIMGALIYGLWLVDILANGFFLYQLCRPFIAFRKGRFWKVLFLLTFAGSSGRGRTSSKRLCRCTAHEFP